MEFVIILYNNNINKKLIIIIIIIVKETEVRPVLHAPLAPALVDGEVRGSQR